MQLLSLFGYVLGKPHQSKLISWHRSQWN